MHVFGRDERGMFRALECTRIVLRFGRRERGKRRIGVTAGASAPQVLVDELLARLKALGAQNVKTLPGITERVVFTLPRELARQGS